jgi:hypothetical protein
MGFFFIFIKNKDFIGDEKVCLFDTGYKNIQKMGKTPHSFSL